MKKEIITCLLACFFCSSCFMLNNTDRKLYGYLNKKRVVSFLDTSEKHINHKKKLNIFSVNKIVANLVEIKRDSTTISIEKDKVYTSISSINIQKKLRKIYLRKEIIPIKKNAIKMSAKNTVQAKEGGEIFYTLLFILSTALLIILISKYPIIAVILALILIILLVSFINMLNDLSFGD